MEEKSKKENGKKVQVKNLLVVYHIKKDGVQIGDKIVPKAGSEAIFECAQATIVLNGGRVKDVLLNGESVLNDEDVEMRCSCVIENY